MRPFFQRRNGFRFAPAAAVLLICGCTLPQRPPKPIKTYLPAVSLPQTASSVSPPTCFSIRPCRTAPAFAGKSLVYRTGESEYETDYYNQLLMTPAEIVTRTLTEWITSTGWTVCPPATPKDSYTITPLLDELYGDFRDPTNPYAMIKMRLLLTVTDPGGQGVNTLMNRPYQTRVILRKNTVRELIAAYSKGLEKIFSHFQKDIETVIGP